jgi:SsrA-binding protein
MAKQKHSRSKMITNRQARHNYNLGDSLVVGLELTGAEAKNLRLGHAQLQGAYVTVKDNELYLINALITGNAGIPIDESSQTRNRKLLAKRREIDSLVSAKQQGRTIVPLDILTNGKYIKLRIAIGQGKKRYDKRQTLKARDDTRRTAAALKRHI